MALTKYTASSPPVVNQRLWMSGEFRRIDVSIGTIILLLEALNSVPIEIGAPNSGGAGFRMLRIPN